MKLFKSAEEQAREDAEEAAAHLAVITITLNTKSAEVRMVGNAFADRQLALNMLIEAAHRVICQPPEGMGKAN